MTIRLQPSALGPLEELAEGGEAVIYRAPQLQLADAPGELVYKRYKRDVSLSALERIATIRERFAAPQRQLLDELAVWPIGVVEQHDRALGVLMPLIPDSFFAEVTLFTQKERIPREVQHLFADNTANTRIGLEHPDLPTRLELCGKAALVLGLLHKHNVVYGDINAKNLLYQLTPQPSVLLVDCDGVRVRGSAAVTSQKHADDWKPPEGWGVQSVATDRYKLGLLILRVLTPGPGTSERRDPARADPMLDAEGRKLLRAALRETGPRTSAKDWYAYFGDRARRPRVSSGRPGRAEAPGGHPGWRRGEDGRWVRA